MEKIFEPAHHGSGASSGFIQNQKYQLLFTTVSRLHCIDVLGRDVENYPIKLLKPDIGLMLDYGKNRNYRFLVPAGTKLYNFSSEGNLIQGWNSHAAAEEKLIQRPLLFQKNKRLHRHLYRRKITHLKQTG